MAIDPSRTHIYHITDVSNLPAILSSGYIFSDAQLQHAQGVPTVIGMPHIKARRLTELTIPCCGDRFVGEFVPFYYCPRSPMLYTINLGNTGRAPGCQTSIVHLVSTASQGMALGRPWAISDGNAGARHTSFSDQGDALDRLDWGTINNRNWQGKTHTKHSEFLVADYFPWSAIASIGCHSAATAAQVKKIIANQQHKPDVVVQPTWYY
jgi:hypothetical protein